MKEQGPQDFLFWKNKLQNSTDWYWSNCIGFILMSGGGSDDLMFIAMLFLILEEFVSLNNRFGFGITVYAILKIQRKYK
jgi:hypothetical protein